MSSIAKRKIEEALSILDSTIRSTGINDTASSGDPPKKRQATTVTPLANSASPSLLDPLKQYRPWDRSDFMARLATYKESTWFDKPVTPVECARHGWANVALERLRCTMCSAQLITMYPDEMDEERQEELTANYRKELVASHDEVCPWRGHPSDASIYTFPNTGPAKTLAIFEQRAQALAEIGDQLPVITHPLTTDQLDSITSSISPVFSDPSDAASLTDAADPADPADPSDRANPTDPTDSRVHTTTTVLSLFGWTQYAVASRHALRCELCLRVVGLWSRCTLRDEAGEEKAEQDGDAFDVVAEHRNYCPWVKADDEGAEKGTGTTGGVEGKAGWEKTLNGVLRRKSGMSGKGDGYGVGGDGMPQITEMKDISAYVRGLLDGTIKSGESGARK